MNDVLDVRGIRERAPHGAPHSLGMPVVEVAEATEVSVGDAAHQFRVAARDGAGIARAETGHVARGRGHKTAPEAPMRSPLVHAGKAGQGIRLEWRSAGRRG